jgi:hypothetical protein
MRISLQSNCHSHSFVHSFIHSSIHPFIHPSVHSFFHLLIHPFTHSFIHPSIHSFFHSFIHPSIHSFVHSLCADFCGALLSIDTTLHFSTNYSVFQWCDFIRISILTTLIMWSQKGMILIQNHLSQIVTTHTYIHYEAIKTHAQDIKLDRPAES